MIAVLQDEAAGVECAITLFLKALHFCLQMIMNHNLPLCHISLSGCSQALFSVKSIVFWDELFHEVLTQGLMLYLSLEKVRKHW